MIEYVMAGVIVTGFAVCVVIGMRRMPAQSRHARQLGRWSYLHQPCTLRAYDHRYAKRFLGGPFQGIASSAQKLLCVNVLTGTHSGMPFAHLDCRTQDSGITHTCCVSIAMPRQFRELDVRPQIWAGSDSFQEISNLQTESEEFNRRFNITTPDLRYGHAVLQPAVLLQLMQLPSGTAFRIERADLLCYRREKPFSLDELDRVLDVMSTISAAIPSHLGKLRTDLPE